MKTISLSSAHFSVRFPVGGASVRTTLVGILLLGGLTLLTPFSAAHAQGDKTKPIKPTDPGSKPADPGTKAADPGTKPTDPASPDGAVKTGEKVPPSKEAVPADTAKKEVKKPVWTNDLTSVTIPDKRAIGKIRGEDFVLDYAELQGGVLSLRQGTQFFPDREFKLFLFSGNSRLDGQSLTITDDEVPGVPSPPHIYLSVEADPKALPNAKTYTGG